MQIRSLCGRTVAPGIFTSCPGDRQRQLTFVTKPLTSSQGTLTKPQTVPVGQMTKPFSTWGFCFFPAWLVFSWLCEPKGGWNSEKSLQPSLVNKGGLVQRVPRISSCSLIHQLGFLLLKSLPSAEVGSSAGTVSTDAGGLVPLWLHPKPGWVQGLVAAMNQKRASKLCYDLVYLHPHGHCNNFNISPVGHITHQDGTYAKSRS